MVSPDRRRPRASPRLLDALREGKASLRRQRGKLDLREKVRIVLEMQRICLPLIVRRRRPPHCTQGDTMIALNCFDETSLGFLSNVHGETYTRGSEGSPWSVH